MQEIIKNGQKIGEFKPTDNLVIKVQTPPPSTKKVMYTGSGANIRSEPSAEGGSSTVVGFANSGDIFDTLSTTLEEPYMPVLYAGETAYVYNKGGNYMKWVEPSPPITGEVYENIQKYINKYCSGTNTQNILDAMIRELKPGDNIMEQWAYPYCGYHHKYSKINYYGKRLPYGGRSDMDIEGDCAEVWRNFNRCFGISNDIGSWTVAQWRNYKHTQFKTLAQIKSDIMNEDYSDWKFGDELFFAFRSGQDVSHVGGYMRDKFMGHTRSSVHPWKMESIKDYCMQSKGGKRKIDYVKGVTRPITDEQMAKLIVK
jgi:hypothetical protein